MPRIALPKPRTGRFRKFYGLVADIRINLHGHGILAGNSPGGIQFMDGDARRLKSVDNLPGSKAVASIKAR